MLESNKGIYWMTVNVQEMSLPMTDSDAVLLQVTRSSTA